MTAQFHNLKTDSGPFSALWSGEKKFEVRVNDRGFREGDMLILDEADNYRRLIVRVDYMLHGGRYGLPDDLCVMSITEIARGQI